MANKKMQTTKPQHKYNERQMLRITRVILWLFMFIGTTIIFHDNTLYCIAAPSPLQLPPINTLSSSSSSMSLSSSSPTTPSPLALSLSSIVEQQHQQQETTVIQPNPNNVDTDSNGTLGGDIISNYDDIVSAPVEIPPRHHKMPFKRIADTSRVGNLTRMHLGDVFNVYGMLIL